MNGLRKSTLDESTSRARRVSYSKGTVMMDIRASYSDWNSIYTGCIVWTVLLTVS